MSSETVALVSAVGAEKLGEIEKLVATLAGVEGQLEGGYAKLAYLLRDASENRYWEGLYKSFGEFMSHLRDQYPLGRAQLYNYLSTARDLGEDVNQDQLNAMGISKAMVLRDAKNEKGSISESAVTAAQDPKITVKELKKLLFEASNEFTDDGTWMDCGFEFYVTDEERALIQDAANAARRVDPVIDDKGKDFMQRKEILLRFCREFLAAYADQVVEGGKGL